MAAARAVIKTAKRAPKLESVISKIDTNPLNLSDEKSFGLNSSDSKWWLQLQFRKPYEFVENKDNSGIRSIDSRSPKESFEFVDDSFENDLGSFESKKSRNLVKSYDLDRPVDVRLEAQKIKSCRSECRKKIMEALCHSQTRAREAECAAKKAYAEKENAIKVMFGQAAQLFAYRQWIYVLQLENLCYQMRNRKSDQVSSVGAFSRSKIGKLDKDLKRAGVAKGKGVRIGRGCGRYEHDLGGCVVVFVVGLGIVGVGLLFGWTVGWMLI